MTVQLIKPTWPAPAHVQAFTTTRIGGVSNGRFDSLNLALHVNDNPVDVTTNRQLITDVLSFEPCWLHQTHSNKIARLDDCPDLTLPFDASVSTQNNKVCVVMTADCLPLLITNRQGTVVLAIHAGWQGLANGIIVKAVEQIIDDYGIKAQDLMVWLGPAISVKHFEIGVEVKDRLLASLPKELQSRGLELGFVKGKQKDKWFADVYAIATLQLCAVGVKNKAIFGGQYCTYSDEKCFFSHRRATHQGLVGTGRMASVIALR